MWLIICCEWKVVLAANSGRHHMNCTYTLKIQFHMDVLRGLLFLYCRWYFLEFLKQWTFKADDLTEDTKVHSD